MISNAKIDLEAKDSDGKTGLEIALALGNLDIGSIPVWV